jgi:Lipocalin-like domain
MSNDNAATRERLIGTWKLVSAVREDVASGAKTAFLGESPSGFLHYLPDGRMMAIIARSGRTKPAGTIATAAEAEALIRSMVAYGGTYRCEGDKVIHDCDISWNQTFTGTKQIRTMTLDGDRLTLSPPPSPDPTDGTISVRKLMWVRA